MEFLTCDKKGHLTSSYIKCWKKLKNVKKVEKVQSSSSSYIQVQRSTLNRSYISSKTSMLVYVCVSHCVCCCVRDMGQQLVGSTHDNPPANLTLHCYCRTQTNSNIITL